MRFIPIYYLSVVACLLFFSNCDKSEKPQERSLYDVVFEDTIMYDDGTVKTLVAQNIPGGVNVSYSSNSLATKGSITASATFSLQNSADWWSFGDIKNELDKLERANKLTEEEKYETIVRLELENNSGDRIDPLWRNSITLTAVLQISKGTQNATDPKFFTTVIKTLPNGKMELEIIGYTGTEKEVIIPAYIGKKAVRGIGEKAFFNKSITSIVFPESDSLHYIAKSAFRACTSLIKITLCTSIGSIAESAFLGIGADSITLWENVKYIGEDAFGQTKLKIVTVKATTPPKTKEFPASPPEGYIFTDSPIEKIFVPTGSIESYKIAPGWAEFKDKLPEI